MLVDLLAALRKGLYGLPDLRRDAACLIERNGELAENARIFESGDIWLAEWLRRCRIGRVEGQCWKKLALGFLDLVFLGALAEDRAKNARILGLRDINGACKVLGRSLVGGPGSLREPGG